MRTQTFRMGLFVMLGMTGVALEAAMRFSNPVQLVEKPIGVHKPRHMTFATLVARTLYALRHKAPGGQVALPPHPAGVLPWTPFRRGSGFSQAEYGFQTVMLQSRAVWPLRLCREGRTQPRDAFASTPRLRRRPLPADGA